MENIEETIKVKNKTTSYFIVEVGRRKNWV